MQAAPAPRLVWAVETMAIRPADQILEIGCGHGVAVSLVCEHLEGGKITALDRSTKMIAAAEARNREHVESGLAEFIPASLESVDLGGRSFNKVFAVHVRAVWDEPTNLVAVRAHLAPGGSLFLFHQQPGWRDPADAEALRSRVTSILHDYGFTVEEPIVGRPGGTPMLAIVAR
jgi:ubiquinone/menaquinone biosynthesis C-methylase UbiE